ncbi:MAG: hypothetical protein JWO91_207 [Acidobacteriaceae bacterium]|nr:hypothetical protein [Acidobacteriaceae bacterium]
MSLENLLDDDPVPVEIATTTQDRVLAALAYFTFIPAVALLLMPSYKNKRFVRFHSLQSILLSVAVVLAAVAVRAIFFVLSAVPSVAFLIGWLAAFLVALGLFLLWVVLVVKAFQGKRFIVPLVGGIAEKQSA